METVIAILLALVAVILFGILTAVKSGFNQVIRGLEALDRGVSGEEPT